MNSENGKKLTLLGFGLFVFANALFVLDLLLTEVLRIYIFKSNIMNTLLNLTEYVSLGIAALGFLVVWMSERNNFDLLAGGATGLSALVGVLQFFDIIRIEGGFAQIIVSLLCGAFYVVLALRAKERSTILALLLGCAFIFRLFSAQFFIGFLYNRAGLAFLPVFLIWYIGYTVCAGLCFVEVKNEI